MIEVHDVDYCRGHIIERSPLNVGRWTLTFETTNAQRSTLNSQRPIQIMRISVTDYLDVVSSWCFWSEPTWAELKKRYEGQIQFQWKIALMDSSGLPTSREQERWFYRRSGMMMRSPCMLNTDWYEPSLPEWLAPNCVAEAAKDFGFTDDRVRLALAYAALREGKKISDWNVSAQIGAEASGIDAGKLLERATSAEIEQRVRASTTEFHALQVTQRPAFVIDTEIGDRAVFSGVVKLEPLTATIDSMLDDAAAYAAHKAHFGDPPAK
jgi:predicted DsbA family dithiol-disulfide isomerase